MQFIRFILALVPIIWLMAALSVLKLPGFLACIITVIITAFESICIWHFSSANMLTAALEGALNALWPICLVIVAALYTYVLTLETGAMEKIKKMLAGVSEDQRVLALLIAWGFGHFMEGMAGFGTAVAIPAGILIALGMEPLPVVVGCLVVNSMPTAFGSVGVPIATISAITGLAPVEIAANTAKIEVLIFAMLYYRQWIQSIRRRARNNRCSRGILYRSHAYFCQLCRTGTSQYRRRDLQYDQYCGLCQNKKRRGAGRVSGQNFRLLRQVL